MPIKRSVTLYHYSELSDKAKAKAREKERESALDYEWWDSIYEDFIEICNCLGIELKDRGNGEKAIWFSGFCHQGDGACFEGVFRGNPDAVQAIKSHAPQDEVLHRIAQYLVDEVVLPNASVFVRISHSGRYYHAYSMIFQDAVVEDGDGIEEDMPAGQWEIVRESLQDLAKWLYKTLNDQYDYLMSDECIATLLSEIGVLFFESGRVADIPLDSDTE